MASADTLSAINQDIQQIVNLCVSSGLNSDQISRCASPLLSLAEDPNRRKWPGRVIALSVLACLLACLFQNTWAFNWISFAGKRLEMKLLPYWDWTQLYNEECIFPNPYMVVDQLTEEDCMCGNLSKPDTLHNVSTEQISEDYLYHNIPFVVTDATQKWNAYEQFDVNFVKKLFTTDAVMRSHNVCGYTTLTDHKLAKVLSGKVTFFHTLWTNCKLAAVKVFRRFYQRPYFLPQMVELPTDNFIAFSSGLTDDSYKDGDLFLEYNSLADLTFFAQVRGSYAIQLRPRIPCLDICKTLEFILHHGETVVLTNAMWELWFAPANEMPSIAIGSTGDWDDN